MAIAINGTGTITGITDGGAPNGPVSSVAFLARNTAPTGWLKANGAAVSRTTYSDLFTAIGTTFGVGDGSTTFNLPDLRGYFPRGWDDSRGIDTSRTFGTNQADDYISHTHTMFDQSGGGGANGNGTRYVAIGIATNSSGAKGTDAAGGTETRPKNVALLACIKY